MGYLIVAVVALPRRLEIVVVRDVGDPNHQDAHPTTGTVDDPGRDVDQRALGHGVLHAVEEDAPTALENVVKLGRTFVEVQFGPVNIHCVRPSRRRQVRVFSADETVAPAAGAALSRGVALAANQNRAGSWTECCV
jgi:hypothetical protein